MKRNIWVLISILLAAIAIGTVILSFSVHGKLQAYEAAYEMNEQSLVCKKHEEIIAALKSELDQKKELLEISRKNKIDQVLEDVSYAIKTFYTIDKEHPSGQRYLKMKNYVTKSYRDYLKTLVEIPVEYTQKIEIQDTYYKKLDDNKANVLLSCVITMQEKGWGTVTQKPFLDIEVIYDSKTKKWQIDKIRVSEDIFFHDFRTV